MRNLPGSMAYLIPLLLMGPAFLRAEETWLQLKYDSRHSGNVPERNVTTPLGLMGAVPLTDSIFTSPVVSGGKVYVVDGAGVAFCMNAETLRVLWKVETRGGPANCNNVSSPAIAGDFLHFGTMAGTYLVLNREDGRVVREISCGEPIFSAPVVAGGRVYFATLGSRVYALEPDGSICWIWDYVKEILGFSGNRWSGEEWARFKKRRVNRNDLFACSVNLAVREKTIILPAGGNLVWLQDNGPEAKLLAADVEGFGQPGKYLPIWATFGLSVGEDGRAYRQTHRLDNGGEVSILRLAGGEVFRESVSGTRSDTSGGLLSFCSVSIRGEDVYRCRPEEGYALCRHSPDLDEPRSLGGYPSIASPILTRRSAVYGGLDGKLYVVPLSGEGKPWSFPTASGKAISAPACVCNSRIYFGCEDGYLYVLGPHGNAPLPGKDLGLTRIRSPRKGKYAGPRYDRFTTFGDWKSTNGNRQGLRPPFRIKWFRRYSGTTKHFSTCGGGRQYTHTGEGMIFAVEQETGRLLWRRYFPGVFISYTALSYFRERLLVPQASPEKCRIRCLDAATGKLLWEAPFSGSPNWNRQLAPIVHEDLVFYQFSTGKFGRFRTEDTMKWLNSYGVPAYPAAHMPLVRAWKFESGEEVWTKDFSRFGSGGDEAGLALMDGVLYYSCFFGNRAMRRGKPGPRGITAALEPATGKVLWETTKYHLHGGCTLSARDGRLYLGGSDRDAETRQGHVWCIDGRDGSLIWRSEPIQQAIKVVSLGEKHCFAHAQNSRSYVIDIQTGKVLSDPTGYYRCTPFTLSGHYLLGINMDIYDLSRENRLVATGPALDTSECVSAMVSNGRIFYTAHGSGLQVSQVYGGEADSAEAPREQR